MKPSLTPSLAGAGPQAPGLVAGRLSPGRIAENFADIAPALDPHAALVAADRCYFCHDAPCVAACPTGIDVPMFIREIATGAPEAAARTILAQNILGGMCARVCPTETLCEEACVREAAEGRPVEIGRLQRYATDIAMAAPQPFLRAAPTGRRVAVVGAGPAGLACAHRLAMLGHDVVLLDAREKGGGLNEYGIAAYKAPDGFAQAELAWLMGVGGIELRQGVALGRDETLEELRADYDAVFLAIGLGGVRRLEAEGTASAGAQPAADFRAGAQPAVDFSAGVQPAVDFIAALRQAEDLSALPVGRRVVVVGGGMTAIDAAVQSRLLGAEEVTILYRRARDRMAASRCEQDLALSHGVRLICEAVPLRLQGEGAAREVVCARLAEGPQGLAPTGETFALPADQVLAAIGQTLAGAPDGLTIEGGKIRVEGPGRTGLARVWAGGDCALGGQDLTVAAVAAGRDAAMDIHAALTAAPDAHAALTAAPDLHAAPAAPAAPDLHAAPAAATGIHAARTSS